MMMADDEERKNTYSVELYKCVAGHRGTPCEQIANPFGFHFIQPSSGLCLWEVTSSNENCTSNDGFASITFLCSSAFEVITGPFLFRLFTVQFLQCL